MISGNFERNPANARERRALAHVRLQSLRNGTGSVQAARDAIEQAGQTRKGQESHFEASFLNAKLGSLASSETNVVFVDWTGGTLERPAFGGYAMTAAEAESWSVKHEAALRGEYEPYNEIHSKYPEVITLTTSASQGNKFQWGRGYDLHANPANARLEFDPTPVVAPVKPANP